MVPRTRTLRRIALVTLTVILVVVVALTALVTSTIRQSHPQTTGEIALDGLSSRVTVLRDERGVPHIYADNTADLFRAQGFVHAQDRFFEMDLRRHVTAGRLAELVGPAGVTSDKLIRTMGWRRVAEQELPRLSSQTRQYLQAYADGVNAYIRHAGKPENMSLEYTLLRDKPGYRVEDWSAVDSLAWLKAMAWELRGDYNDELTRARLGATLPAEQVAKLYPAYPSGEHRSILGDGDWSPATATTSAAAQTPAGLLNQPGVQPVVAALDDALASMPASLGRGEGLGSNSWVVDGKHSSTGRPLLANDPHLGLAIPGIWTQVGLHCRTVSATCPFNVSGFSFSGLPGVVIGHNDKIAWGFTNLGPDVTDFYLEDVQGDHYLRDGERQPVDKRTEVIKVAGGADQTITVRSTVHGPILSDVSSDAQAAGMRPPVSGFPQNNSYAISLAWTGLIPSNTADAIFGMNTAADFDQFRSAAKNFAVPAQNLVYADTAGHIGYQAPGMIPVRESSTAGAPPGFWPAPGWVSTFDWKGFVPFEQMPWVKDPAEGFIVTANNQVTASSQPFLTTQWDQGFRAQRIRELLMAKGTLSPADMAAIQSDTYNAFAPELTKALLAVDVGEYSRQAQALLTDWDHLQPVDKTRSSSAASYYNAVWANLLALTFGDEMPSSLAPDGGSRWMAVMSDLLKDPRNAWWDDKRTPGVIEGRDEILRKAMVKAHEDLVRHLGKDPATWHWGRLHELTLKHHVMSDPSVPGAIRSFFERGALMAPGGSSIVNAFSWNAGQSKRSGSEPSFEVLNGPSMRMVVDVASFDSSTWINAVGQSGHAGHPHYDDQLDDWLENRQRPWPFSESAVRAAARDELTLTAARAG